MTKYPLAIQYDSFFFHLSWSNRLCRYTQDIAHWPLAPCLSARLFLLWSKPWTPLLFDYEGVIKTRPLFSFAVKARGWLRTFPPVLWSLRSIRTCAIHLDADGHVGWSCVPDLIHPHLVASPDSSSAGFSGEHYVLGLKIELSYYRLHHSHLVCFESRIQSFRNVVHSRNSPAANLLSVLKFWSCLDHWPKLPIASMSESCIQI